MFEPTGAIERSVMGWGNRGWVEIIEFILETCIHGALKTHIMYKCNLNSKQITQYVEFLIGCKLLEGKPESRRSKRHIYKTTELGKKYISAYKQLYDIFN
jgi:predicted transcriptional regulator